MANNTNDDFVPEHQADILPHPLVREDEKLAAPSVPLLKEKQESAFEPFMLQPEQSVALGAFVEQNMAKQLQFLKEQIAAAQAHKDPMLPMLKPHIESGIKDIEALLKNLQGDQTQVTFDKKSRQYSLIAIPHVQEQRTEISDKPITFDKTTIKDFYAFKSALRHMFATPLTSVGSFAGMLHVPDMDNKKRLKGYHTSLNALTGLQNIYDADSFSLQRTPEGSWMFDAKMPEPTETVTHITQELRLAA